MRRFLLVITLLAICNVAMPQSFAKFVGKTITVESKCRGEVQSGKVNRKGNTERTNNEVFVLADAQTLVWSENCHLNIYNVTINSDGDLDVETTIVGTPRKWFQLLKAENGSLTIWSDDSYLRYATASGTDQGVANNNDNAVSSGNLPSSFKPGNFSPAQIAKANTVSDASYLSDEEKLVIIYCNLARLDGATFVSSYLSDLSSSRNAAEKSLISELPSVKNLPMLFPNQKIYKAAKYHVDDIGPKGLVQHDSSNGTSMGKRLRSFFGGGFIAENISFGYNNALQIVRQLLIDDGVAGYGHRRNILGEKYTRIGTAIGTHKQYRYMCVQDFSDSQGD